MASCGRPAKVRIRHRGTFPEGQADVAQLVAHHLAKVRVAGSNPVVRSERPPQVTCGVCSVEWPRGEATACKAVYTGSNPVSTSAVRSRAIGAAGARFPDTEEVTGSIPVSPTRVCAVQRLVTGSSVASRLCCSLYYGNKIGSTRSAWVGAPHGRNTHMMIGKFRGVARCGCRRMRGRTGMGMPALNRAPAEVCHRWGFGLSDRRSSR